MTSIIIFQILIHYLIHSNIKEKLIMMQYDIIIEKLKNIDIKYLDYMSILSYSECEEIDHMDIDIFAILREQKNVKLSNYDYLRKIIDEISIIYGNEIHAFSTFKHQIYFINELKKNKIFSKPFHLLIYPNLFYLFQWEIPSRINSMFLNSKDIFINGKFTFSKYKNINAKYNPYCFLQILYEAFISYKLSNINSDVIFYDIMKRIEYSVKNLVRETFYKLDIYNKDKFKSGWDYLFNKLYHIKDKNIDTDIVYECFEIRKDGYDKHFDYNIESHFLKSFKFYDELIKKVFSISKLSSEIVYT